jgi:hypothetical protein
MAERAVRHDTVLIWQPSVLKEEQCAACVPGMTSCIDGMVIAVADLACPFLDVQGPYFLGSDISLVDINFVGGQTYVGLTLHATCHPCGRPCMRVQLWPIVWVPIAVCSAAYLVLSTPRCDVLVLFFYGWLQVPMLERAVASIVSSH